MKLIGRDEKVAVLEEEDPIRVHSFTLKRTEMNIRRLLTAKGLHFFVTRFGPRSLRGIAFDEKYRSGSWDFVGDGLGELPELIDRYLLGGNLLMLGCGRCSILEGLKHSNFAYALGVDISSEAIRIAGRFASDKVSFQVADMSTFEPTQTFDVILFSESLYYIPVNRQDALLNRLGKSLNARGVFVATLAQAKRYRAILERLRRTFSIVEDRAFDRSSRHLIVFRLRYD